MHSALDEYERDYEKAYSVVDQFDFIQWLLDPARFAELVDGAIKEGIIGKEKV